MKHLILTFIIALNMVVLPSQKANAGIILFPATAGAGGALISAGIISGITSVLLIRQERKRTTAEIVGILSLFTASHALIILDAHDASSLKGEFETIPSYVFAEIDTLSSEKSKNGEGKIIGENLLEIILTDAEVDSLFSTFDERVDMAEANKLRTLLTTSSSLN